MKDMIGQELNPGDYFVIPGGNPRYGGLIIEVGVILSLGNKMMKTLVSKFDKVKLKPTNKTSKKVLKVTLTEDMKRTDAVIKLQEYYEKF